MKIRAISVAGCRVWNMDGTFEYEFTEMRASWGARSFNTGYTTHYYDVTDMWIQILDENDTDVIIREIRIGSVYLLNRVT